MFFLPAMPLTLFLLSAWFGRLWKSLWILYWNTLWAWHIFGSLFHSPPTQFHAVYKINHWHRFFHVFAQHKLIGEIAKTQGNSQGSAPVLFANIIRILQPSQSSNEFDFSCCTVFVTKFHFCCELTRVNVLEAFLELWMSLCLYCSSRFFCSWCSKRQNPLIYHIHRMVILTIIAPSNNHTIQFNYPVEKPSYTRLLSISL